MTETSPGSKEHTLDFLTRVTGRDVRSVERDYGNGYVRLSTSESARRQAKHDIRRVEDAVIELLRNARDAGAHTILVASSSDANRRIITMIDDGAGIEPEMFDAIFEPRVTNKLETMHVDEWGVHGRGMALYSIKENAQIAHVTTSRSGYGTSIGVEFDLETVPERADQSTMPTLRDTDSASTTDAPLLGPHNIMRTCVEFALMHPDVRVIVGSPSEIVATLVDEEFSAVSVDDSVEMLIAYAASSGLHLSERNAYRIRSGDIGPCADVLTALTSADSSTSQKTIPHDDRERRRNTKITHQDRERVAQEARTFFEKTLGERLYLELIEEPTVRVGRGEISLNFQFSEK
ncbi:MAG: ATP-binding protein [Coriobacteriia bacterium]|nr:ATP-binding protein [Coriobacteriia bacterium]